MNTLAPSDPTATNAPTPAIAPTWGRRLAASWRAWVTYEPAPPQVRWLTWIWTALLSVVLAAAFTVLAMLAFGTRSSAWADPARWAHWFGENLVVCATISALIHLLFDLFAPWARPRVEHWHMLQRALFFCGVPLLGVVVGWPLGIRLAGGDPGLWFGSASGQRVVWVAAAVALLVCALMYQFFGSKAQQYLAERRAAEAQLRLLQAQMEPHFLFNTLANVHSLIEHDAGKARAMLGAFTDYLRASLAGLRRDEVTLADELALAEAYLRVQATRLEERLHFRIDADEAARAARLLPLLLQPLVENAVVHGIEPQVNGGAIEVRARLAGGELVIEVHDDGRGLREAAPAGLADAGNGVALVNVRERLAARYGAAASLAVRNADAGTRATLRLPATPCVR